MGTSIFYFLNSLSQRKMSTIKKRKKKGRKKKRKKKGKNDAQKYPWAFWSAQTLSFSPSSFLFIFGRKHFGDPKKKHLNLTTFFFLSPPNQTN